MKDDMEKSQEFALQIYTDNLPYDQQRVVAECKFFMMHLAASKFELGKRLMILKEKEGVQTFALLIDDHFPGMSRRSAFNYMAFAKKCLDISKIKTFGEKNWSKVLAILDTCSDDDLKEIEENGINGHILDEYDGMSVRDFKRLLKQYKTKAEKIIGKQVSKLEEKNRELNDKVKLLNLELRSIDKCADAFQDAYEAAHELLDRAITLLNNANVSQMVAVVLEDKRKLQKYINKANLFEKKFKGCLAIMREALS